MSFPESLPELLGTGINNTREFIMDSQIDGDAHILDLLGITRISAEVAESEDRASTQRLMHIRHLVPMMRTFSGVLSSGTAAHSQAHLPEETLELLPDGYMESVAAQLHTYGFHLLLGTISQLVDRGFLAVPEKQETPKKRGLFRRG